MSEANETDDKDFGSRHCSPAVRILEFRWQELQPSRYKTLTESAEDAAWMSGFSYAIEFLRSQLPEQCVSNEKYQRDIESIRHAMLQALDTFGTFSKIADREDEAAISAMRTMVATFEAEVLMCQCR